MALSSLKHLMFQLYLAADDNLLKKLSCCLHMFDYLYAKRTLLFTAAAFDAFRGLMITGTILLTNTCGDIAGIELGNIKHPNGGSDVNPHRTRQTMIAVHAVPTQ